MSKVNFGYTKKGQQLIALFQLKSATLANADDLARKLNQLKGLTITNGLFARDGSNRYRVGFIVNGPSADISRLIVILEALRVTDNPRVTTPDGTLDRDGLVIAIMQRNQSQEQSDTEQPETDTTTTDSEPTGLVTTRSQPTAIVQYWEVDMSLTSFAIFRIALKDASPTILNSLKQSLGPIFLNGRTNVDMELSEIVIIDMRDPFETILTAIEKALRDNGITLVQQGLFANEAAAKLYGRKALPPSSELGGIIGAIVIRIYG